MALTRIRLQLRDSTKDGTVYKIMSDREELLSFRQWSLTHLGTGSSVALRQRDS